MRVFRILENGKVEQASFNGRYNTDVWNPLELLDTYTEERTDVDEDGLEYTYTVTLYPEFVLEQNGRYVPDLEKIQAEAQANLYQQWKADRQEKVDNIEVTYNDVIYQGDETSQTRMDRAIRGLEKEDELYPDTAPHTQTWVAKDNSSHQLTAEDLTLIMVEAGRIQGQLWNEGRPSA